MANACWQWREIEKQLTHEIILKQNDRLVFLVYNYVIV